MTPTIASRVAASIVAAAALSTAAAPGHAAVVKAPLPAVLTETESSAEDLVDYALAGERSKVVATAASLEAAASGLAGTALTRAGVPSATVARLEQRANRVAQLARSGPFVEIMLAANAVSQLMPALYAHFEDPVPTAILTLDYLDREAQFRSLARQPQKVAKAVVEPRASLGQSPAARDCGGWSLGGCGLRPPRGGDEAARPGSRQEAASRGRPRARAR